MQEFKSINHKNGEYDDSLVPDTTHRQAQCTKQQSLQQELSVPTLSASNCLVFQGLVYLLAGPPLGL